MAAAIASQKRYQVVAATLAKAIGSGVYPRGQRLPSERDLAEQFKVSRPTVREALIALDIQGLVEARHGSGIYVIATSAQAPTVELDIGAFELTEARRLFEGEAAALAATSITDEELSDLEGLVQGIREENERHESGEKADRSFHVAIAKATRNGAIVDVVEHLWDIRERSPLCKAILQRARDEGVQPMVDEHKQIVAALRTRDPAKARKAMRAHLERVITGLLKATETEEIERKMSELDEKRKSLKRRIAV